MRTGPTTMAVAVLMGCMAIAAPPAVQAPTPAASAAARAAGTPKIVTLAEGVKLEFVWCPPGTFMASDAARAAIAEFFQRDPARTAIDGRRVQGEVTLTRGFWIGKYEVTQAQWMALMGSNPSKFRGPRNPVETVSWNECQGFLKRLNLKLRGAISSLPTEAQWEYACRAGSSTEFSFGDGDARLGEFAWHKGNAMSAPHPVGGKKPNAWGAHDMHGNVSEWCQDWYDESYPPKDAQDPAGPAAGKLRMIRGGAWMHGFADYRLQSARRDSRAPAERSDTLGFRLVLTESPAAGVAQKKSGPGGVKQVESSAIPAGVQEQAVQAPTPAASAAARAAGTPKIVTLAEGVKLEFVWCPPGSFMASDAARVAILPLFRRDPGRSIVDGKRVKQEVTLTRGFWMGKHEVTQAQWMALMGTNPSKFKGPRNPVETVSWTECQGFLKRLNLKLRGVTAALPTEAQWEYACRAGSSTEFSFGDDADKLGEYAWYKDNAAKPGPHAVGGKKPNAWGAHDMHGNVAEWCEDWYGGFDPPADGRNPYGPAFGKLRVVRGGAWTHGLSDYRLQAARRDSLAPGEKNDTVGFRLVLTENTPAGVTKKEGSAAGAAATEASGIPADVRVQAAKAFEDGRKCFLWSDANAKVTVQPDHPFYGKAIILSGIYALAGPDADGIATCAHHKVRSRDADGRDLGEVTGRDCSSAYTISSKAATGIELAALFLPGTSPGGSVTFEVFLSKQAADKRFDDVPISNTLVVEGPLAGGVKPK